MADKKITALTAETDIDSDDLAHIVTDVSTSATNKKITVANVFNKIPTYIGYGADSVETVNADGASSFQIMELSILSIIWNNYSSNNFATRCYSSWFYKTYHSCRKLQVERTMLI